MFNNYVYINRIKNFFITMIKKFQQTTWLLAIIIVNLDEHNTVIIILKKKNRLKSKDSKFRTINFGNGLNFPI